MLFNWMEKSGIIVKRKYSAICLVKYYKGLFVGVIFCSRITNDTKKIRPEFLSLSLCIFN